MKRKFNIIDVIIILVVIVAIAVASGFLYFKTRTAEDEAAETAHTKDNEIKLAFVIEINNISETMSTAYEVGRKVMFDSYGNCEGVIRDIEIVPYRMWTWNTEDGEVLINDVPDKYTARITIETDVIKEENKYNCSGERISIGKSVPFKTKGAAVEKCYIVDLYEVK